MIRTLKFKEITTKIGSGSTPTGGNEAYKAFGTSLIRSMNVYDFTFKYDGLAFIDEKQANKLKNVSVEENDILLNITGASVARCCMVPSEILPARVNQHVSIIRVDETKANPKYVLFYINSPSYKSYILGLSASGATREALTKEVIENLTIPLPPLPIQQKIASILSSYDELIENNKQRIQLLEEMAEEIYKEWFVRLRFPGYETAKIVDGLPEGWEKVKADQIFDIKIGKTPPREETKWFTENKQGIKWISIRDINSSSVFIFNTNEEIVYDGISKFNLNIVKKNTVILSFKLTVGKIAIATEDMVSNEAIAHFNIIDESIMNREYIYCYLKNFQYAELGNTSSIGNAINSKIVKRMPIIKPAKNIINRFSESICSMLDEIDVLNQKNQLLQETRDLLLPRLISGKLSVEHLVEEELGMVAEEKAIYKNKNHN